MDDDRSETAKWFEAIRGRRKFEDEDAEIDRLRAEVEQYRETNRRLNARCQLAESAVAEKAKNCKPGSFGRILANAEGMRLMRENERLLAIIRAAPCPDGDVQCVTRSGGLCSKGTTDCWKLAVKRGEDG